LGSHIYNAWLAQLIVQGKAPGLAIVPQHTNVLFDLLLGGLFNAFGASAAQRIAVALAVLIFTGGAVAFCRALGRQPWTVLPLIVPLAYGWVFHMGFFNFYLSLGLCFWALAAGWGLQPKGLAAAGALLALAFVAHGLAVAWAAAALAWRWTMQRWPAYRWRLFVLALAAIAAIRVAMVAAVPTRWDTEQIGASTGAVQVWVYGQAFARVAVALGLLWLILIAMQVRRDGVRAFFDSDLFQVCALTAAGILIVPNWAWLPGYAHALVFISQRMSLALAVCLCALAAGAPARRWQAYAAGVVAILFFGLLYPAERALNHLEDAEDALVAGLPQGARVASAVEAADIRVIAVTHMIDRACIGRCFSYENYEPSSGQFRIRVVGPQNMVAPTDMEASRLQTGYYVVRPQDVPLYQVEADASGGLRVRSLQAGVRNGMTVWNGLAE